MQYLYNEPPPGGVPFARSDLLSFASHTSFRPMLRGTARAVSTFPWPLVSFGEEDEMTKPEIVSLVTRLSWLDTLMACAFRRACGVVDVQPMDDDEPSEFYASLMRQRYGALDNPKL